MKSVNDITLLGHVGQDPELRTTSAGTRVAKFSLATNFKIREAERTDWHRIVVFGRLADIVEQYVSKGDRIYVRGRVEYSTTEDADGNTRYFTDIIANELVMLGDGGGKVAKVAADVPDEIPF